MVSILRHFLMNSVSYCKNGRASESLEYFQIIGNAMSFYTAERATETKSQQAALVAKSQASSSEADKTPSMASLSITPQAILPVRPEDVSFNLNISLEEQLAKRNVQLPYTHQGTASTAQDSNNDAVNRANLFFIDEDDPDWDDDDLDDDLDV